MSHTCFLKIFAILFVFHSVSSQITYPYLLGGTDDDSYLRAIDVAASGDIVVGGKTDSANLLGSAGPKGIIYLISSGGTVSWAKSLDND